MACWWCNALPRIVSGSDFKVKHEVYSRYFSCTLLQGLSVHLLIHVSIAFRSDAVSSSGSMPFLMSGIGSHFLFFGLMQTLSSCKSQLKTHFFSVKCCGPLRLSVAKSQSIPHHPPSLSLSISVCLCLSAPPPPPFSSRPPPSLHFSTNQALIQNWDALSYLFIQCQ